MAGRLAVLLPGVFALLAVFSTTAQAFHGCAVSFDGCSEQHCEPLVFAGTNRVR